jgi:hypothetical protein
MRLKQFQADRILLYVGEGTHTIIGEKNRYELFEVVQHLLDEEYHRDR